MEGGGGGEGLGGGGMAESARVSKVTVSVRSVISRETEIESERDRD